MKLQKILANLMFVCLTATIFLFGEIGFPKAKVSPVKDEKNLEGSLLDQIKLKTTSGGLVTDQLGWSSIFADFSNTSRTDALSLPTPKSQAEANAAFGKLPMSFEINQGQTDSAVRFLAHGSNYNLYLTNDNAVLSLYRPQNQANETKNLQAGKNTTESGATLQMKLADANPSPQVIGVNELEGKVNYIIGKNPDDWKTNISTYSKVKYENVYQDIDLIYYGNQSELEYDFIVAPQADPNAIKMTFDGAEKVSIDEQSGELILQTAAGEVRQHAPVIYQETNGERKVISGRYKILEVELNKTVSNLDEQKIQNPKPKVQNPIVGFEIDNYDKNQTLVIDPVLIYSTYLGGNGGLFGLLFTGDKANSIAVDENGFAYIAGVTHSTNFPLVNPTQAQCVAFNPPPDPRGCLDAFVTKFNQAGNAIVYSTYLGGSRVNINSGEGTDVATGIALDNSGNAFITGNTTSPDFPTTSNSFQPVKPCTRSGRTGVCGFVTKLNSMGAIVYSTYLGSPEAEDTNDSSEQTSGIAVDASGNAYVTGVTLSGHFPMLNGFRTNCLIIGYHPNSCAGNYSYLTKLNADGSALLYSTFIGGAPAFGLATQTNVVATDVAVDNEGNAFVTGATSSGNFPVRRPLQRTFQSNPSNCILYFTSCSDAFVMKINTNAGGTASLTFSTFLGGHSFDQAFGISLDAEKNVYVTGYTNSTNFPVTPNAYDTTCGNAIPCTSGEINRLDTFVTKIKANLKGYAYSTFLGGDKLETGRSVAVDTTGNIYVLGLTDSTDFPTTADAIQQTLGGVSSASYITKFKPNGELEYSTYLRGGQGDNFASNTDGKDIAVDLGGNIYVTGGTNSYNFPVKNAFQPTNNGIPNPDPQFASPVYNAFITKIGSQTPVIFIPGVSGSLLYDTGAILLPERWVGIGSDHRYLTLNQSSPFFLGSNIYAPDVIRRTAGKDFYGPLLNSLKTQGGYVEYDVNNNPGRRTPQGCDFLNQQDNHPSLFVFAYDWRRDNARTANQELDGYIQCIQQFYGANTKVNIVAHSMGNYIARRYILEHPNKVKKLITIGAPWLGGPKIINVMATGQFFDSLKEKFAVAGDETFKFLVEDYAAAHQILPSRSFFALGGRPYREVDGNGNIKIYNYDEFIARINELYPRTRPGDTGRIFHDFSGQDDWRNDTSGVQYYHIIGLRSQADTVNRVQREPRVVCTPVIEDVKTCETIIAYRLFYTTGDGTVPRLSAERKANGLNFNAPNARIVPFSAPSDDFVEHTGLNNNPSVQKAVLAFLNERVPTASPNLQNLGSQKTSETSSATPVLPIQSNYVVNFAGLSAVTVADEFGNNTAPLPDNPSFIGGVPGVSYQKPALDFIALTMPTGQNFTVTFSMPNQPIMLEWLKGTNKITTAAGRYLDLNLPQNTQVQLTITTQGVQDLRYDSDGNGSFETLINPTSQTSGANANDKDAPLVSFSETAQGGMSSISITALDGESGVNSLFYSTNGTTFQSYTAPLLLIPSQTIYAYSDDNAGNRSATVSYQSGSFKLKINGNITDQNGGVSDAVLNLTDSQNSLVTTESVGGGIYAFSGLTAGNSYTLTPEHPYYTFIPSSVPLANLSQNATVNFTATRKTYNISGRVTDDEGNGAAGVSLVLTGGQTANTIADSNGNYSFFNLAAGEDYIITAAKPYFDFKDSALQVSELSANETADFTGTQKRFGISGQITNVNGDGFSSVSVTVTSGGQTFMTQTDSSGFYFFDELDGGNDYTVTPSKTGVTFMPQNRSFNNLTDDAEGNFTSPTSPNTWTGEISTDWFNPVNWVGGAVPPGNANVFIPSGALNEIAIGSADVNIAGLTLETGRILTVSGGRNLSVTNDAAVNGNLNGEGTFVCRGTTIFGGTTPQTVPKADFNNLFINNPSGISFLGDVTINGELNLTDGIIDTGAFTLTFEDSATVVRTNGFVTGNLRKNFTGFVGVVRKNAGVSNTFVFPVGTNSSGVEYSPIEANVTNVVGDSGYLTVKAFDTISPASINSPKISRYWDLNGANITADLIFHYLAEDDDNINNPANLRVFRDAQNVCATDCVNESTFTASVSGVTNFSPWTIAELAPTAATAAVGGRVVNSFGQGVARVRILLTDSQGNIRYARTNSFGYYSFEELETGQTYLLEAQGKGLQFQNNPRVLSINEDAANEDFLVEDLREKIQ